MKKYASLLLLLLSTSLLAEQISIKVLDAKVKNKRVRGAEVLLQQPGKQTLTVMTNDNGRAIINSSEIVVPESKLIIKKTGFSDLVANCPCDGLTYALSPVIEKLDGMRIVLNWENEPQNLDAHLIYPNNHVYFGHETGDNAELDVEDAGGYGPETITINKKYFGQNYIYAVQNYSDINDYSDRLSKSGARVFVYVGQSLVRTYDVPRDLEGNIWIVFKLNPNGDFEDINTIDNYDASGDEFVEYISNAQSSSNTPSIPVVNYAPTMAKDLNKKGKKAYHDGNLNQAISYYQSAIANDENYSQAYSNLGLAYQKKGNVAEAIWANRKAISLATGVNANIVRASSYFKIAKIYEHAGQYADALQHYQLANQQKNNEVYVQAIERMKGKL